VSGTQQPGVYYLKYVYLDEPRRKIITDVLSEELEAFGNAMQEGDAEPPQIADRTPGGPSGASVGTDAHTEAHKSASEDSGRFSKVSARADSYAAIAKAAQAKEAEDSTVSSKPSHSRNQGRAGWNPRRATKQIADTQWLSKSLFIVDPGGYDSDDAHSELSSKASVASKPTHSVNV